MRLGVVGSRAFPHLDAVRAFIATLAPETVVVTGGAAGVDRAVERAARARHLAVEVRRAQWYRYGNAAGRIRNGELVAAVDQLVVFWDGVSRGTAHVIQLAETHHKPIRVISS